jgi:hypothetical protein
MARQPAGWVARHLLQHGAMVASGILMGYANRFAAHMGKHRPALLKAPAGVLREAAGGDVRFFEDMHRGMPRRVLQSFKWWPPTFPQPAFPVYRCGWKGLHTALAVARISASCCPWIDSFPELCTEREFQQSGRKQGYAPLSWRASAGLRVTVTRASYIRRGGIFHLRYACRPHF